MSAITDADLLAAVQGIKCPEWTEDEIEEGADVPPRGCDAYQDHGSCSHTYLRELRAVVRLAAERACPLVQNALSVEEIRADIMRALCGGET